MNINELPEGFLNRMKEQLGDSYEAFLLSYEKPYRQALRVNELKVCAGWEGMNEFSEAHEEVLARKKALKIAEEALDTKLEPVPWCDGGYYYSDTVKDADGKTHEVRPGKSPLHDAGLYYIQEPSAMIVGTLAGALPGERVLDLCAAPGGKTTALASSMNGKGILIANEIHPARVKILSENVERMGISNCYVMNETPEKLATHFPAFFDKIIVDAPCSGEGMFRKEPAALEGWSLSNVAMCAERQKDILKSAMIMLSPGGRLVYSTCTFATEEDEEIIEWLLENYSLDLIEQHKMYPHEIDGEGHFCAVLAEKSKYLKSGLVLENSHRFLEVSKNDFKNLANLSSKTTNQNKTKNRASKNQQALVTLFEDFAKENIKKEAYERLLLDKDFISYGDNLYAAPRGVDLRGIKCLRPGLQLGTAKKDRFEPAHAFALALRCEETHAVTDLSLWEATRYVKGETLPAPAKVKGWCLVTCRGASLGWGKASNGIIKNHFPKGLRHN